MASRLPRGSVALFAPAPLAYMSHDVPYPFQQAPDLHYLCGFAEPSCLLACVKRGGGDGGRSSGSGVDAPDDAEWLLFALWDGPRAGIDGARRHILPDGEVLKIGAAPTALLRILDAMDASRGDTAIRPGLLFDVDRNPQLTAALRPVLEWCKERQLRVTRAAAHVQPLRLLKSDAEAALMARAADATAEALRGCGRLAYPCVVASGVRACTLHYMHNNALLSPGSFGGYSADITRTWPLSGTFTPEQRDVYSAVLSVNEACIAAAKGDGGTSIASLHHLSLRLTHEAGGHYLGLDVHDTPLASQSQPLLPGMAPHPLERFGGLALTVEPGLYFPPDDPQLPAWCRGIGVRIEDDIVIGSDGAARVLTTRAPKAVAEVEEAVRRGL
ncbi:hypothetical protein EMIHUDRAFT_224570 [Emiliania huxleyi CCMP1516]|uniref:Aminopeptidase P N-terminal domain-containing protein n=2 Tax=Emiliania huxleyi TaxID=2903 RepID=A0A0D3KRU3_EMIH1|nr:hypothetical protein EMIHUDRAFT_224570 [Emiliania huxleyi CCMP1516]EOD38478.1 hypothetical protein EMIHUDRAFT_224570 [Emiliania huxleyi CCMP1516]|eukprot:XP_005790907.1 hypothetical protein EMIHUDRAFT_224570 [Emiliania huxleyi CCMP1516]